MFTFPRMNSELEKALNITQEMNVNKNRTEIYLNKAKELDVTIEVKESLIEGFDKLVITGRSKAIGMLMKMDGIGEW